MDEQTVNEVLLQYAKAKIQGEQQDREFHENPDKKAAMRNIRQGEHERSGETYFIKLCLYIKMKIDNQKIFFTFSLF